MHRSMPHPWLILGCLACAACTAPSAPGPEPDHIMTTASETPTPAEASASAGIADASISGAIHIGNQPAPAMRICAMAVTGAAHACVMASTGDSQYRIDALPAGRYHLIGWVREGELKLIAHADIVRCVRAPCPPDQLRVVELAPGQSVVDIDLSAAYTQVPTDWPAEPAN